MTRARKDLGNAGEAFAARTLTSRGFKIVERNTRDQRGEIDIIAELAGEIYFVEVRTVSRARWGATPLYSVTPTKQARIVRRALAYLASHSLAAKGFHFSVFAIAGNDQTFTWLPDAFAPDLSWG